MHIIKDPDRDPTPSTCDVIVHIIKGPDRDPTPSTCDVIVTLFTTSLPTFPILRTVHPTKQSRE